VSHHEVLTEIAPQAGTAPKLRHEPEREGDQRYFVADTRRLTEATGWRPLVGWRDGLLRLGAWLAHEHGEVAAARAPMTTRIPA
jgi:CDP-paratose 2-epimerase